VIRGLAAIGIVATAAMPCASAAEWRIAPSVGTTVVSESNPRFMLEPVSDQQAITADLGMRMQVQSETTSVVLNTLAARRQYDKDRSLDRTDLRLDLSLQHAASERLSWSAAGSVTRDTTLTSELGTSGATRVGYRHESLNAQLQPQWQLGERWSAATILQWQRDYYPTPSSGLVDYQYRSAGLVSSWRNTSRDSIAFTVRSGQLNVAEAPAAIKDASASLEYKLSIDEQWNLSLAGGPTWSRGSGATLRGENFSFGLTRSAERGSFTLAADRGLAPTGRGFLTRRDSLSLQLRKDFAPQLSGTLGARYLRSRNVVGALGFDFDDVRYRRVDGGLGWTFSQQWITELRAGYADQQQRAISGALASGFDIGLGIRWNGKNHVF
jgi:hypothetical protein